MIVFAAIFLWVLSLLAVMRLLSVIRQSVGSTRVLFGLWALAVLLAVCLLFRPHEDIFGGEDPGSYINSGITYGRQLSFFHVDPLLCQVSSDTRPSFYYGHSQYGTTKDACLWVRDADKAIIGPHFQPAYPLLISMVSRLGSPTLGLYVIPLFAVFTAIALGALASQCLNHRWAGITAFIFYVLNPLVLWHGRCARPEIIAGFFFFGGSALILHAWTNKPWSRWPDLILGTLCVGFAPFFHITAWLLVIPSALVVALVILHGRDDFLLVPIVALAPLTAFVYQVNHVTDYYAVGRFLDKPLQHFPLTCGIAVAGLFVLVAICLLAKHIRGRRGSTGESRTIPLALSAGLAVATLSFFLVSYATRDPLGSLPMLARPVQNYLYLTDLNTFVNMVSKPMALLTLTGWTIWLTGRSRYRQTRIVIALAVIPGIMLAGTMDNFMMTRYLLVAIIPISALSLAALVTLFPDRRPYSALPGVLVLVIGLFGLQHRTHLATLTEHRGLARFLKPFAEIISKDNGILLCEYSRIAAPFEHFFGIPTLGLDNERHDDYSSAERAWETIMRNNSGQPAFFMTPFQPPISDRFDFAIERSAEFIDRKLQQAHNNLPTRVTQGSWPLALYRMTLRTSSGEGGMRLEPYVVFFEPGNMGLRRFANLRIKSWPVEGMEWQAGEHLSLALPPLSNDGNGNELFMLMMAEPSWPSPPMIITRPSTSNHDEVGASGFVQGSTAPVQDRGESQPGMAEVPGKTSPSLTIESQFLHLADNWWLFRVRGDHLPAHEPLVITAASPMFLVDVIFVTRDRAFSILKQFPRDKIIRRTMVPMKARWTRADAEVLIPLPQGGRGAILMLLQAPEVRPVGLTDFTLGNDPVVAPVTRQVGTGQWQWQVWPLRPTDSTQDTMWLKLHTDPAWNSQTRGFPADLGVLIGYIIVLQ